MPDFCYRDSQFPWACGVLQTFHTLQFAKIAALLTNLMRKKHPLYVFPKGRGAGLQGVEGSFAARPSFAAG